MPKNTVISRPHPCPSPAYGRGGDGKFLPSPRPRVHGARPPPGHHVPMVAGEGSSSIAARFAAEKRPRPQGQSVRSGGIYQIVRYLESTMHHTMRSPFMKIDICNSDKSRGGGGGTAALRVAERVIGGEERGAVKEEELRAETGQSRNTRSTRKGKEHLLFPHFLS